MKSFDVGCTADVRLRRWRFAQSGTYSSALADAGDRTQGHGCRAGRLPQARLSGRGGGGRSIGRCTNDAARPLRRAAHGQHGDQQGLHRDQFPRRYAGARKADAIGIAELGCTRDSECRRGGRRRADSGGRHDARLRSAYRAHRAATPTTRARKPESRRFATRSTFRPALAYRAAFRRPTTALLVAPPLFWAGNAVLARALVGEFPPLALSFWRWTLAFVLIAPFAAHIGMAAPRGDSRTLGAARLDEPARRRLLQLAAVSGAANFDRGECDVDRCLGTDHHVAGRRCLFFFAGCTTAMGRRRGIAARRAVGHRAWRAREIC